MQTRPVFVVEAVFKDYKSCSNKDYFIANFVFPQEAFGKVFKPEDQDRPVLTGIVLDANNDKEYMNFLADKKYYLQVAIGVSKPNMKNGKNYPASISYNLISVKLCS